MEMCIKERGKDNLTNAILCIKKQQLRAKLVLFDDERIILFLWWR